ncbi:MAG: alpha/beta hydrolase [Reyranellaceae bacterium]
MRLPTRAPPSMTRRRAAALGVAVAAAASMPIRAQETAPVVALARSRDLALTLPDGRAYRLMMWVPPGDPPASGWPVIYFTDANAVFGLFAGTLGLRARRRDDGGLAPAVLVGIGYPGDAPFDVVRRTLDLTPEVARERLGRRPDGSPWPPSGGAAAFLQAIEDSIKPRIERAVPIDRARQTLFGHSFGGLFALNVLFTRPGAFQTYIAGSPSIWFGDGRILELERAFAKVPAASAPAARLMIGVGAWEQELSPAERAGPDPQKRQAWKRRNRMVDNAREMASRLAALQSPRLRVRFREFADEDHISVLPVLISHALDFALRPST